MPTPSRPWWSFATTRYADTTYLLPTLGGWETRPEAVNTCGSIVGFSDNAMQVARPVRWDRRSCDLIRTTP